MRVRALTLMLLAVLAAPAVADAHVFLRPDQVPPGSFDLFTVLSPNESPTADLTGLRLTIPQSMEVSAIADTPGFRSTPVTDQVHRIVGITWSGGHVPPRHLALFEFSASVTPTEGTIHLTGVQTFADGTTKVWTTPQVVVAAASAGTSSDTLGRVLGAIGIVLGALALVVAVIGWRR